MDATQIEHKLAEHTLTNLRDQETGQVAFRKGLVKLGRVAGYEIIDQWMEMEETTVQTPITQTSCKQLEGLDDIVIINILRAATPFVEGLLKAFPTARQGVISASRGEEQQNEDGSFPISVDYAKLPEISSEDTVIVADPMLATGSTMCAVLEHIDNSTSEDPAVFVLSAVSAPEGITRVNESHPQAEILTVAVDDHLNEKGYIVPGLGDAGDRAFKTD